MTHPDIAELLLSLRSADFDLRAKLAASGRLNDGYDPDMERLHNNNAAALESILARVGLPTADKVGPEAAEAAWLIVQHAISRPGLQRHYAELLTEAVAAGRADPIWLAYLEDRIAVFEGRPQRYGSQFDWDARGDFGPQPYDDLAAVNRRRAAIGLDSLEARTRAMREDLANTERLSPADLGERKRHYDAWRRRVGWLAGPGA